MPEKFDWSYLTGLFKEAYSDFGIDYYEIYRHSILKEVLDEKKGEWWQEDGEEV